MLVFVAGFLSAFLALLVGEGTVFGDMRAAYLEFTAAPNFSWRLDSVNRLEVFVSRARSVFRADILRGPVLLPQRFSLPIFLCTGPSSSGS
jgi:hypothetical protein